MHRSVAIDRINASPTLAITARVMALKRAGVDVIGLGVGEPDFDTPDHVKEAAIAAIRAGQTKYTDVDGTPELKAAIVTKFARDNELVYTPAQVTANVGGKQTLFNAMLATLDPGDEVIVPAPYWVSYPDIVQFAGGTPVVVGTAPERGYRLTPDQLDTAITPRTRWLILNQPSNPTGAAYTRDQLEALGAVLARHPHVLVYADDMYEHILFDGYRFFTMAQVCPALHDRVLTANGCSKGYAMTGWRLGFAGGPEWLIRAMAKLQSQSTSNPCSIAQAAAVAALTGDQSELARRAAIFQARRDLVVAAINAIPGLACPTPDGAFYVYVRFPDLIGRRTPAGAIIADDTALATYLLDEARVAVVPGVAFGASPAMRISYATTEDMLMKACGRIASACAALA